MDCGSSGRGFKSLHPPSLLALAGGTSTAICFYAVADHDGIMVRQLPKATSMAPDYYKILRVRPDADELSLKCAYHKLAFECHPDRNAGSRKAEQKFKE